MPANWKLRELLRERGVKSASEISRVLEENDYQLSIQAVCNLLNAQPKMIRLETIQAICDSFYIRLSDFLEVLPSAAQNQQRRRAVSRGSYAKQRLTKVFSKHNVLWLLQPRKRLILRRSIQMHESFHQTQQ